VVGLHGDRLKIVLQAPPVDGQANEALMRFLAKHLGVGKQALALVRGTSSREKTVTVQGDPATATRWIDLLQVSAAPTTGT
jgi:uncharacterized protein (TIGR00251 family)